MIIHYDDVTLFSSVVRNDCPFRLILIRVLAFLFTAFCFSFLDLVPTPPFHNPLYPPNPPLPAPSPPTYKKPPSRSVRIAGRIGLEIDAEGLVESFGCGMMQGKRRRGKGDRGWKVVVFCCVRLRGVREFLRRLRRLRGEGMLISRWYGSEIRDCVRVLGRVWGFRGSISG